MGLIAEQYSDFAPLHQALGVDYDKTTQLIHPVGKKGILNNGERVVLFIGYDSKNEQENKKSIVQVLTVILRQPVPVEQRLYASNWTYGMIQQFITNHTNWVQMKNTTPERQFYKRFVSPGRKNKNMRCRIQELFIPASEEFIDSLEWIRCRVMGRLSFIYKKKDDPAIHLADTYLIQHTVRDYNYQTESKVFREYITPVLIGDEDATLHEPSNSEQGRLQLKVPLDSLVVQTKFNRATQARPRELEYDGIETGTLEDITVKETVDYVGNTLGEVAIFLNGITSLRGKDNDYLGEITHPGMNHEEILVIESLGTKRLQPYIASNQHQIFDYHEAYTTQNTKALEEYKKTYVETVALPYWWSCIEKLIPVKINQASKVSVAEYDYV